MRVVEHDFDIEDLLNRPLIAHLATFGDAGPCETPVWFLWDGGAVWIIANSKSSFVKRLVRDERASIGIVEFDLKRGFLRHLGMRGAARVLPIDVDHRTRIVARYLGSEETWDSWFKTNVVEHQDVLVKFVPDLVIARDQSYFRSGGPSKVEGNMPTTEQLADVPLVSLDHVQLAMPSGKEDRAREFYVGVLGFQEVTKPPELAKRGGCWFNSGDVHVHLGVDAGFLPAEKAHPAFRCVDYYGYVKRLSDRGVHVVPDEILLNGKAHCYFADPFGNRLELVAE